MNSQTLQTATVDSDLLQMVREVLAGDVTDRLAAAGTGVVFDDALWKQLAELGLVALTTPESDGGSGAGWLEAAALYSEAAATARHLPLVETDLLANWLLRTAGLPAGDPTTPRTVAVVGADGRAAAVPWLGVVESVVIVRRGSGGSASLVEIESTALSAVADITPVPTNSGQPRADLTLTGELPTGTDLDDAAAVLDELALRGALARAASCAGALEKAVDLAVEHTSVRVQFGRPLAAFQAVQQLVADSAAEAALARAAVDAAVLETEATGLRTPAAATRVAVARSCAGHAASVVVRNTHQAHGAIGTTQEHPLHLFTLAALDWRSEFGTTRAWDRVLGRLVRQDPPQLWPVVTGQAEAQTSPHPLP
ncbi:acyl-CoA dehydrogenase family protein [Gordonia hydrophobica]|uniref:Acyl-CoA dehydrogenase family protein n=1 Tax=Gordonia hydrophobica TaxID=40516 RepID=A0ABZ2U6J1_9ACTN|nr:acyl-CoA dehydrogenase family protein [Gordonia hydrophobica]MBM7365378.1 acyl-CoA dehydrogenase [Gordonia hydrophobica]